MVKMTVSDKAKSVYHRIIKKDPLGNIYENMKSYNYNKGETFNTKSEKDWGLFTPIPGPVVETPAKKRGRPKDSKNKKFNIDNPEITENWITGNPIVDKMNKAFEIGELKSKGIDPKESLASKKRCFDSVTTTASLYLAQAMDHGASKYGAQNWLELPDNSMSLMTYINAIHRHWLLLRAGQDLTSDAQVHHLAAIMAGCAVALDAITFGKMKDDRVKLSPEQIETLERMIDNE